jgi:Zn-dependent M28 family amino/carboxypeptidase
MNRIIKVFIPIIAGIFTIVLAIVYFLMIWMPGTSYQGTLPTLSSAEDQLRNALRSDVEMLSGTIGQRNSLNYAGIKKAAEFLEAELNTAGYTVNHNKYQIDGKDYDNLEVEIKGNDRPDQIILIGAHYDSVPFSPGANDNTSGTAATLELAKLFAKTKPARTLRFVHFVNEEQPFAQTEKMGSLVYAKQMKAKGETIMAMFSLESLGYYTDRPNSQPYPAPLSLFYPSVGNFISFIGNVDSRKLVRTAIHDFRLKAKFPSEGAALPNLIPGVGSSDHWSFWQMGYPAIMVTDTANYRDPNYHQSSDRAENLDYDRFARVTFALAQVIADFTGTKESFD